MHPRGFINKLLFVLFALAASAAPAQSVDVEKQAAIERYLNAVPIAKMMDETYTQMAKQMPVEKRAQFISDMRSIIKVERVDQIARAAMLKTFSAEELNALADFYSSKHGATAMAKFGPYMAEMMPAMFQEVQRGMQELQARTKK